jgi:hypothetical protein
MQDEAFENIAGDQTEIFKYIKCITITSEIIPA